MRSERNNKNGEAKQHAYQKFVRMNLDVQRFRKRKQEFEQYKAIKELVAKGELTDEALKGLRFAKAERNGVNFDDPEQLKRFLYQKKDFQFWTISEVEKWTALVKKHGRNFGKISRLLGTKSYMQCFRKSIGVLLRMQKGRMRWDQELYDALTTTLRTRYKHSEELAPVVQE